MSTARTLGQCLLDHAASHGDNPALVSPEHTISYTQLASLVAALAAVLQSQGIGSDSVVGIKCAQDLPHLVLCLAASALGATSCTIPSHEEPQAQSALANRCGVTHWVDLDTAIALNTAYATADDTLSDGGARLLFSTSGTTGEPKLVVHQDCDIVAQAHRHVGSTAERFACVASIEHNFAKRHRLYVVATGATNVFLDAGEQSLVAQCLALEVNVLHVSAFQAQELLAQPGCERLVDVRLKLGGGHVPGKLREQLRQGVSHKLQAGYGTTETGAIGFTDPDDVDAEESVGQPLPGIDVRVVDPNRKTLGAGERGELAIRCEGMFREYLGNPELTAQRLDDGWFYTGDIGLLDSQGRIHLSGRSDDMFIFNSMNIYPQDIESAILEHPSIADVAVIPKASPVHGQIPVALLVFKSGVKHRLPDVEKFVRQRVGVRRPRQYVIVAEIPKTASGKVLRSRAAQLPQRSGEVRGAILGMLEERTIESLSPSVRSAFERGDRDIKLKHLEMDSLARMSLLIALELEFETIITPQQFASFRYLGNVVAQVLDPAVDEAGVSETIAEYAIPIPAEDETPPKIVRVFRRMFRFCRTVAQLNQALTTLEVRLVPGDIAVLHSWHTHRRLIPSATPEKYQVAIAAWLEQVSAWMRHSGKEQLEWFRFSKVARQVGYFEGPGRKVDKTLLICFPPRDFRQMGLPNPVFLQHVDAEKYDVLIVSSVLETGFRRGRSIFASSLDAFTRWFSDQECLQPYGSVRTFGFSAGGRAAIVVGHELNAALAVCVSGRFHRKRYPLKNLDQLLTLRRLAKTGEPTPTILSYTADNPRDRRFAGVIAAVSSARRSVLSHKSEKLKHLVLQQLLEQGELASYLATTVFATPGSLSGAADNVFTIEFDEGSAQSRPAGDTRT